MAKIVRYYYSTHNIGHKICYLEFICTRLKYYMAAKNNQSIWKNSAGTL